MPLETLTGTYGSQRHQVRLGETSLKFDLIVNDHAVLVGMSLPEIRRLAEEMLNILNTQYATEAVMIKEDAGGSIQLRRSGCSAHIAVGFIAVVLCKMNGSLLVAQEIDGHWYRGMIPVAITEPVSPPRKYDAGFVARQLAQIKDDWKP